MITIIIRPNTQDFETLERLAGVQKGTAASLNNKWLHRSTSLTMCGGNPHCKAEAIRAFSQSLTKDEKKFDKFMLEGWGPLKKRAADVLKERLASTTLIAGAVFDPDIVQAVLDAQGITLPDGITVEDLNGISYE